MSKIEIKNLKDRIEQLFIDSVAGKLKNSAIPIGKLTESGKTFLQNISGLSFKDEVTFYLHPSDLRHIYLRHYGTNEKDPSNLAPLTIDDIRNIADVLIHPDAIAYLGEDQKGKKFAMFLENANGCYNLIEVYAESRGKITPKTYYNAKKGVSQSAMDLLAQTSETYGATLMFANIPILLELTNQNYFRSTSSSTSGQPC